MGYLIVDAGHGSLGEACVVWQALGLLVSVSFTHYCASTSDLSTLWSAGGLTTLLVWESSS